MEQVKFGNSVVLFSISHLGSIDNDVMENIIDIDDNFSAGRVGNYSIVNSDTGEIVGGGLNGTS